MSVRPTAWGHNTQLSVQAAPSVVEQGPAGAETSGECGGLGAGGGQGLENTVTMCELSRKGDARRRNQTWGFFNERSSPVPV